VNETKISVSELKKLFEAEGIETLEGHLSQRALRIDKYDFIRKLPGYGKGFFSVQDESSMYAVERLAEISGVSSLTDSGSEKGDAVTVLELCAAPGGKSLYMAELLKKRGTVISRDISEAKTDLIRENKARLGLTNVDIQERDAVCLDGDMIGRADIVIADVPCSGLGVMGHKNDIKYNVTEESLAGLGKTILRNAAMYVKHGGTLMFSTCTINPGENGEVVKNFMEQSGEKDGFKLVEEKTFLQGIDPCDGFYYAIMVKNS
jgi:16S rRNA (cytosine967-C5)-methyltransferase